MKKNDLSASIIIIGYNGKEFLPGCLDSLIDQTFPSNQYEIIYADNASSDNSAEFVEKNYPEVKTIRFDRNLGFSEGNNQAAKFARGRYLLFLNQDTIAHRKWIEAMIKAMSTDPTIVAGHAAGCPLNTSNIEREYHIDRGFISEITKYGTVEPVEINLTDSLIQTLHIGGGSMILDRKVIDQLDYIFDPGFTAYCEDLDLGLRLNGMGLKVVFVPSAVCYHDREGRTHPSRITLKRTSLATKNRFLAYIKNMYFDEFLISLPRLFMGSIIKMKNTVRNPVERIIYGIALVPFTALFMIQAFIEIPNYMKDRQRILKRRNEVKDRHWLMKELIKKTS